MLLSWRAGQMPSARAGGLGDPPEATITYIICTNPRSGSYLLCDGLASTSLAGRPREWFSPRAEEVRRARWGLNKSAAVGFESYVAAVRARSRTKNGISGVKLHYYQFVELEKKLASIEGYENLTTAAMMRKAFPNLKYLWLTRRDKARQAVSFALAERTGVWCSLDGRSSGTTEAVSEEPEFEPNAVALLEEKFRQNDTAWRSYFAGNSIIPLTVCYEDLAADYRGTVVRVLKWLGLPNAASATVGPSRLTRQSNAINEDWLRRYALFQSEQGSIKLNQES
jgi:LPS sulfotransferase NodH